MAVGGGNTCVKEQLALSWLPPLPFGLRVSVQFRAFGNLFGFDFGLRAANDRQNVIDDLDGSGDPLLSGKRTDGSFVCSHGDPPAVPLVRAG
jgi:hypothetical protein